MSIRTKSLICFSISGAALFGGAVLAPVLGAAPAAGLATAMSASVAPGLQAIGGSLLANITERAVDDAYRNVEKRLRKQKKGGLLPQNHDFFRAVRRSQLHAMMYLVESFAQEARDNPGEYANPDKFKEGAVAYINAQLKAADRDDLGLGGAVLGGSTVSDDIRSLYSAPKSALERIEALWTAGRDAAWSEFEEAVGSRRGWPGQAFRDWFNGQGTSNGYGIGYVDAVQQFFAEKVKTDGRLQAIVFMDQLTGISTGVTEAIAKISQIDGELTKRFKVMEELLLQGTGRVDSNDGMADRLLTEIAGLPSLEAVKQTISNLLPHDDDLARLTADVVRQRMDELLYYPVEDGRIIRMPKFFGREDELRILDNWLAEADRGLRVLCAPSGGGKSALMAAWVRRRNERGDDVVRHFISLEMPDTYTPSITVRHLLDQLRKVDRKRGVTREMAITGDDDQLKNTLYGRLCQDQPPGAPKLIIVVDGLDELIESFPSSFVNEGLGKGVYVIVSRRAERGIKPPDLLTWLQVPAGDDRDKRRIDLGSMKEGDVLTWLEDIIADADQQTMEAVAKKLADVTDGLPLFLEYVINIELLNLQRVPMQDRLSRIMALSAPFSGFLRDYIEGRIGTLGGSEAFSKEQIALFTILALTLGPISEQDISAVYRHLASRYGLAPQNIGSLNSKLRRWLSIREASDKSIDASPRLAFDHPRLASEFKQVLHSMDQDLFKEAEAMLWSWSMAAWKPSLDRLRSTEKRGAVYATRYAPQTGLGFHQLEEVAEILMDQDFIRERFLSFDAADAAYFMSRDWTDWDRVRREARK